MEDTQESNVRTHKDLRAELRDSMVRALKRVKRPERCEVEIIERGENAPAEEVCVIRVRDLDLPEPTKGERPWHVYRVRLEEEY